MMSNAIKSIGIAFAILLLSSCGKETQNTTQGGGVFKVRVTIDPPLQSGAPTTGSTNSIALLVSSSGKVWSGGQQTGPLSTLETDEISVTSGQNVQFFISTFSNMFDRICRTIKSKLFKMAKSMKCTLCL